MKKILMSFICLFLTFSMILYLGKLVRPTDTDDDFLAIRTFHELPEDSVSAHIIMQPTGRRSIQVLCFYMTLFVLSLQKLH